jgi:FkbM family methyltransferase
MKIRLERYLAKGLGLKRVQASIPGPAVLDLPVLDVLTFNVIRHGCYEPLTLQLILTLVQSAGVFVDVGAHFGQFALAASAVIAPGGKVVAIEPNPGNYLELVRNVRLNGRGNVFPVLAAASGATGLIGFDDPGIPGNTCIAAVTNEIRVGEMTVSAFRLADILRILGLPGADVVKIDAEGHDSAVLDGLLGSDMPPPPHIIFEYLPRIFPQAAATVVPKLRERGYHLRDVTGKTFDPALTPPEYNVWASLSGV